MRGMSGDRNELRRYFTLSQVGLEMVVPIGIGVLLDRYLAIGPWGVTCGAILGLVLGLVHIVKLSGDENSPNQGDPPKPEAKP